MHIVLPQIKCGQFKLYLTGNLVFALHSSSVWQVTKDSHLFSLVQISLPPHCKGNLNSFVYWSKINLHIFCYKPAIRISRYRGYRQYFRFLFSAIFVLYQGNVCTWIWSGCRWSFRHRVSFSYNSCKFCLKTICTIIFHIWRIISIHYKMKIWF